MLIDIVVVNFRCDFDTQTALTRLADWPHGTVWVVDNSAHDADIASATASLHVGCAALPWVRVLIPASNIGFGQACNLAFVQSRADFFLLLNPDARISVTDVLLLANTLQETPTLAAVSPKIFWNEQRSFVLPCAFAQTPWHSLAMALATRWQRLAMWAGRRELGRARRQMAGDQVFTVDFLAGAVMMLRRSSVLAAGGLFDPDYFMFFEDSDLSVRLRRAGYRLAMVPQASAVHEYRHKAFKAAMMAHSQLLYFEKLFPLFFRCSDKLRRVGALSRPVPTATWFRSFEFPIVSLAQFTELTQGRAVLAFSPSLLMMPAFFRAGSAPTRCFDAAEWALLEPGAYVVLLAASDSADTAQWFHFHKG